MEEAPKPIVRNDICKIWGHEPVDKVKTRRFGGVVSYIECDRCGKRLA